MDHYASWKDPDKGTPQLRGGEIDMESLKFIPKMERSLVLCLMEMYINGVSTRKVRKIMEPLCGENISKSMVSRLCKELDHDIEAWNSRDLSKFLPLLSGGCPLRQGQTPGNKASPPRSRWYR